MNKFTVCKKQRSGHKPYFVVYYRHPETGQRLSEIRINSLAKKLGLHEDVGNKYLAIEVAQKALNRGIVFQKKVDLIQYLTDFWDFSKSSYVVRKNKEKANSVSEGYCAGMKGSIGKYLAPYLPKGITIEQLKPSHIEKIKDKMLSNGISGSTINRVVTTVRIALKEAYRTGMIFDNIGERLLNVSKSDSTHGILTPAETHSLLEYLKSSTKVGQYERLFYQIVGLAIYCGCRSGELRALKAEDFEIHDSDSTFITIDESFSNFTHITKSTKGKKTRFVVAPTPLCKEILESNPSNDKSPFLFFSIYNPGQPKTTRSISDDFRASLEAIGISKDEQKDRKLSFHSCRHYYATVMENKLGTEETRKLLGHADAKTTEHYANHKLDSKLESIGKAQSEAFGFDFTEKTS